MQAGSLKAAAFLIRISVRAASVALRLQAYSGMRPILSTQ